MTAAGNDGLRFSRGIACHCFAIRVSWHANLGLASEADACRCLAPLGHMNEHGRLLRGNETGPEAASRKATTC